MDFKNNKDYNALQALITKLEQQLTDVEQVHVPDFNELHRELQVHFGECIKALTERQDSLTKQLKQLSSQAPVVPPDLKEELGGCLKGCKEILAAGINVYNTRESVAEHIWQYALTMRLPTINVAEMQFSVTLDLPPSLLQSISSHGAVVTTTGECSPHNHSVIVASHYIDNFQEIEKQLYDSFSSVALNPVSISVSTTATANMEFTEKQKREEVEAKISDTNERKEDEVEGKKKDNLKVAPPRAPRARTVIVRVLDENKHRLFSSKWVRHKRVNSIFERLATKLGTGFVLVAGSFEVIQPNSTATIDVFLKDDTIEELILEVAPASAAICINMNYQGTPLSFHVIRSIHPAVLYEHIASRYQLKSEEISLFTSYGTIPHNSTSLREWLSSNAPVSTIEVEVKVGEIAHDSSGSILQVCDDNSDAARPADEPRTTEREVHKQGREEQNIPEERIKPQQEMLKKEERILLEENKKREVAQPLFEDYSTANRTALEQFNSHIRKLAATTFKDSKTNESIEALLGTITTHWLAHVYSGMFFGPYLDEVSNALTKNIQCYAQAIRQTLFSIVRGPRLSDYIGTSGQYAPPKQVHRKEYLFYDIVPQRPELEGLVTFIEKTFPTARTYEKIVIPPHAISRCTLLTFVVVHKCPWDLELVGNIVEFIAVGKRFIVLLLSRTGKHHPQPPPQFPHIKIFKALFDATVDQW